MSVPQGFLSSHSPNEHQGQPFPTALFVFISVPAISAAPQHNSSELDSAFGLHDISEVHPRTCASAASEISENN